MVELRQTVLDMELRLAEKDAEVDDAVQSKNEIERKLSEAAKSAQQGSVVQLQLQVATGGQSTVSQLIIRTILLGNGKKSQNCRREIHQAERGLPKASRRARVTAQTESRIGQEADCHVERCRRGQQNEIGPRGGAGTSQSSSRRSSRSVGVAEN